MFTQSVRDDDVRALEAFRSVSARLASNPINSLGLFNKVDKLVGGVADPWPVAGPLAAAPGGACCAGSSPTSCRWSGCSPRPPRPGG